MKKEIEDKDLFYNTMPGLDDHIEELEEEYDYNDDDGWVKKDGEKVIHSTYLAHKILFHCLFVLCLTGSESD